MRCCAVRTQALLGMPADAGSYLAMHFPDGVPADLKARLARIEARYREIGARTGTEFGASWAA